MNGRNNFIYIKFSQVLISKLQAWSYCCKTVCKNLCFNKKKEIIKINDADNVSRAAKTHIQISF